VSQEKEDQVTEDIADAVGFLQHLSDRYGSRNFFLGRRYDEALDDLLRQPERHGDPRVLAQGALRNAAKKIDRRNQIALIEPVGDRLPEVLFEPEVATEVPAWFRGLAAPDRAALGLVALGFGPAAAAQQLDLPAERFRVRLFRARSRAAVALAVAAWPFPRLFAETKESLT
jgi:hypothetical protein